MELDSSGRGALRFWKHEGFPEAAGLIMLQMAQHTTRTTRWAKTANDRVAENA
jgi:hypothetical protein